MFTVIQIICCAPSASRTASKEFHDLYAENKFWHQPPHLHSPDNDPGLYDIIFLAYLLYRISLLNLTLIENKKQKPIYLKALNLLSVRAIERAAYSMINYNLNYPNWPYLPKWELHSIHRVFPPNFQQVVLEDPREHHTCTQEYVLSHSAAISKGMLRVASAALSHTGLPPSTSRHWPGIVSYPQQQTLPIKNIFVFPRYSWPWLAISSFISSILEKNYPHAKMYFYRVETPT